MQILCLFCLQDMYAILALNYIIDVLLIFMVYYVLYHKPQKCCYSNWYGHKSAPMFQLGLTTRELLSCIISGTSRWRSALYLCLILALVQTSISATNTRLCDIRNIVIALPGNPQTLKSLIQPRCLKSPFNGYGVGLVGEGCYPPHPSWFLHKFELLAFLYISIDCSFIIDIHAEEVLWIQG